MTTSGYVKKGEAFHYPEPGCTSFSRVLSVARTRRSLWVAAQLVRGDVNTIVVRRLTGGDSTVLVLSADGVCHQPSLVALPDDDVAVTWNESTDDGWTIRIAVLGASDNGFERIATVGRSAGVCLAPAVIQNEGRLCVAWSAGSDGGICSYVAGTEVDGGWGTPVRVSALGTDAFRPRLAAGGGCLYAVWDQYSDGRYSVTAAVCDGDRWRTVWEGGRNGERWFCPHSVAAGDGTLYVTWVAMKEVEDELGIRDHSPSAMVGRFRNERFEILEDGANAADPRIVADLREGLLAVDVYKGYKGLRRRPQLALADDGTVRCLWEVRLESEGDARAGHLVSRQLNGDGSWSEPAFVHSGGYGYVVEPRVVQGQIAAAFLRAAASEFDILDAAILPPDQASPYRIDTRRWARWQTTLSRPDPKPVDFASVDGAEFRLFWADTHCHSSVSPDAEGEVDELIHFARDVAGLDAVCVVDNDFYPHKALSEAEWRLHQAFAAHFTEPGQFVVFPGYEFTFHDRALTPDFNHRTVVHPVPGGRLLRRIDAVANSATALCERLRDSDAMCAPHHCSYELCDPSREWNVEVCSSWRVCMAETDFTIRQLRAGHHFGFLGASDTHRAVPGLGGALTGVYAEALTPEALFEGYRSRRTIATQGFPIFIDVRVAGAFIGGEATTDEAPLVEARVNAPRDIECVQMLRDGNAVHTVRPGGTQCAFEFRDDAVGLGEHFYFLRVILNGDPSLNMPGDPAGNPLTAFTLKSRYPHNLARARGVFAWSSPIWVTVRRDVS